MSATLADRVLAGDARAIARAISVIEDESVASAELIRAIFAHTGRAYLIGVTGPPGAGKSTLVDRLITEIRQRPVLNTHEHDGASASGVGVGVGPHPNRLTVGILAVDPTSPFSGGAVLGDRLRMQSHAGDEGVFIRSMATRGHLGGLARATADAALVLDASGKDIIVIETVGVGQDEVEIVRTADVSIVTLVPGAGDEVQALKAGIMEIADIFVVNKADREGSERLVAAVEATLSLATYREHEWRPPIVKTVATSGQGVPELMEAIAAFRVYAERDTGPARVSARALRRRLRSEQRLRELVSARCVDHLEREVLAPGEFATFVDRIAAREMDPYTAADLLLGRVLGGSRRS